MLTTITLHGAAARFGGPFRLDVRDPRQAVRALCLQLKGFREFLAAGEWRVTRARGLGPAARQRMIGEDELGVALGRDGALHFIPMPIGSKNGGIGKIILGAALITASFFVGGPVGSVLFSIGVSSALAGVSQLVAPSPKVKDYGDREENPASRLFNGAVNLTEPGNCFPLALGRRVRTGSLVAQEGLSTEQL